MILIIGLGNSEDKYRNTRHNVGRDLLMEWQKRNDLNAFSPDKKIKALISENKKAIIILPETMMNKSGAVAAPAIHKFKIKPKNIFIIHDDADIELGNVKLSFAKHSAGHKGVESVRRSLGSWDFWRLRIGIQKKKRVDAMKLVLQKFSPADEQILKKTKKKIFGGLDLLCTEGPERAMNVINQN